MTTAYHPQTNGGAERTNQEIEAYLRLYCSTKPHAWANHITPLEFAHNSAPHSVHGETPFKLIMGYTPKALPNELITPVELPTLSDRLHQLSNIRKEATAAHELARRKMTQHHKRSFKPFSTGQMVWLEATNIKIPNTTAKLSPKRHGPFRITKKLSDLVYELQLPKQWKIHPVFHASLLTPYHTTVEHGPNYSEPPPDIIEGEEEYEIEDLVAHKGKGARRQYLVKWKGYPTSENEWIPIKELQRNAQETLQDYNTANSLNQLAIKCETTSTFSPSHSPFSSYSSPLED